jgi:GT2 family glycosyltransferase
MKFTEPDRNSSASLPFISIIIPTFNRPVQLASCLQAVTRLDYAGDRLEVIVVDDGGAAQLDEVVRQFDGRLPLKLLRQQNGGPAAARNTGASAAIGELLVFTDDDCAPESNWLQALASQFLVSPDCAVGGQTLNALSDNIYSITSQLLIGYLYSYFNATPDQARFFASNNLALPADRFRSVGGFDTSYALAAGEDRELCDRWLHLGHRMVYVKEAVVYHAHSLTFRSFVRQHFNYGRGAFCFHQVRARRGDGRIQIEPLSFYLNLLAYSYSGTRGGWAPIVALLMVTTQVANAAGFFLEKANAFLKPNKALSDTPRRT